MDDLCQYAYETCRQSITVETIGSWLEFLDTIPSPAISSPNGASTPDLPPPNTIFGPYAQRIKDDVFHFLVVTLPEVLNVQGPVSNTDESTKEGRGILLQIFSKVPFELFKAAIESPTFQIGMPIFLLQRLLAYHSLTLISFFVGSDQSRFKFAKDAIEVRKRGIARGAGAEETVVLAFGGSNFGGSAVHVTRKMRKRPLWKVNS